MKEKENQCKMIKIESTRFDEKRWSKCFSMHVHLNSRIVKTRYVLNLQKKTRNRTYTNAISSHMMRSKRVFLTWEFKNSALNLNQIDKGFSCCLFFTFLKFGEIDCLFEKKVSYFFSNDMRPFHPFPFYS